MNSRSTHSLIPGGGLSIQGDQILSLLHQFLGQVIVTGHPHIAIAACAIGISVRSLQRYLTQRGTSYSRVVAAVRFQLASFQLLQTSNKLIDIALDLGYSDAAAFSRAFGRWAGVCPQQYRSLGRGAVQASAAMPVMNDRPLPVIDRRAA